MILNLITSFVQEVFSELNSRFDNTLKIKQIKTDYQEGNIPASQQAINYNLFISGITNEGDESGLMNKVTTRLDFTFLNAQKNNDNYKLILDRYIWAVMRLLNNNVIAERVNYDDDISQGLRITDIGNVTLSNGDRFEDEFFRPSIEFVLTVMDVNTDNLILVKD